MTNPDFLECDNGRVIAYHRTTAQGEGVKKPGTVFFGGFKSDMTGTKAQALEEWAQSAGRAFLRFDYSGHGASSGDFDAGCIGEWRDDARAAVEALTDGPQIFVGSSMGGWIALLLAREMPQRVAGLVGIAAAPDFTEDSMWRQMSARQRNDIMNDGYVLIPSDYDEPYKITRKLIEDGRDNLVMRAPLPAPFPVRLLQGTADADVPFETAVRLVAHLDGPDIRTVLVKDADHRMSAPAELALIAETVEAL